MSASKEKTAGVWCPLANCKTTLLRKADVIARHFEEVHHRLPTEEELNVALSGEVAPRSIVKSRRRRKRKITRPKKNTYSEKMKKLTSERSDLLREEKNLERRRQNIFQKIGKTPEGRKLVERLDVNDSRMKTTRETLDSIAREAGLRTDDQPRNTKSGHSWDYVVETGKLRNQLTSLRKEDKDIRKQVNALLRDAGLLESSQAVNRALNATQLKLRKIDKKIEKLRVNKGRGSISVVSGGRVNPR